MEVRKKRMGGQIGLKKNPLRTNGVECDNAAMRQCDNWEGRKSK